MADGPVGALLLPCWTGTIDMMAPGHIYTSGAQRALRFREELRVMKLQGCQLEQDWKMTRNKFSWTVTKADSRISAVVLLVANKMYFSTVITSAESQLAQTAWSSEGLITSCPYVGLKWTVGSPLHPICHPLCWQNQMNSFRFWTWSIEAGCAEMSSLSCFMVCFADCTTQRGRQDSWASKV